MARQKKSFMGVALLTAFFALPQIAAALTVEGKSYSATATVEGQSLKLVGAGLREKWYFDVYTMGAYSASGNCGPSAIINNDEAKYLRMDMLRTVSAEKMAETLGESFTSHLPKNASAELQAQVKTFLSYFVKECAEGSVLEFIYIPGKGTILKQAGKQLGSPLAGKDFMRLLWDIYFGPATCCSDLKGQILGHCK